jgi:hypothetical protein
VTGKGEAKTGLDSSARLENCMKPHLESVMDNRSDDETRRRM